MGTIRCGSTELHTNQSSDQVKLLKKKTLRQHQTFQTENFDQRASQSRKTEFQLYANHIPFKSFCTSCVLIFFQKHFQPNP